MLQYRVKGHWRPRTQTSRTDTGAVLCGNTESSSEASVQIRNNFFLKRAFSPFAIENSIQPYGVFHPWVRVGVGCRGCIWWQYCNIWCGCVPECLHLHPFVDHNHVVQDTLWLLCHFKGRSSGRKRDEKKIPALKIHKGGWGWVGRGTKPLVFSRFRLGLPGLRGASEGQALANTAPTHHWPYLLNMSFLLPDTVTLDTGLSTQSYVYC